MGSSINAGLGGLINANVFKKLSQPKTKSKVTTQGKMVRKGTTTTVAKTTTSKTSKSQKTNKNRPINVIDEPAQIESSVLTFRPNVNSGFDRELAKSFSTNKAEQDTYLLIFKTIKTAYDVEATKLGRKNDVAMALTFFIGTTLMVYHDSPEPSEEAIDNVYQTLADSLTEDGNLATSSDLSKQQISDTLVYISGIVLAGYMNGKQTNDKETLDAYRVMAGSCLQTLMKIDPDSLKFSKNGLQVN